MIRLDELPMAACVEAVRKVIAARGNPTRGMTPQGVAAGLQQACRGWTVAELEIATQAAIATESFWPGIPAIVKHRPLASSVATPVVEAGPDVCRSCGVHYHWRGFTFPNGVTAPRLRCACPRHEAGWSTPAALAWVETDRKVIGTPYDAEFADGGQPMRRAA